MPSPKKRRFRFGSCFAAKMKNRDLDQDCYLTPRDGNEFSYRSAFEAKVAKPSRVMGVGFPETTKAEEHGCWSKVDSSLFRLRAGFNYAKTGNKEPSLSALYEPIGFDFLKNESAVVGNVASKLVFPPPPTFYDPSCCLPALLISCGQFPIDMPGIFGSQGFERGVSGVCYFHITKEAHEWAKNLDTAPPQVRLWHKLFTKGTSDRETAFKVMGMVVDFDKKNLPLSGYLKQFNGKPMLLKFPFSQITRGKQPYSYVEIDFDIRKWSWLTRTLVSQLKDKLRDLVIDMGCVVEAVKDEDMPERLLAGIRIHGFDWMRAEILR